MNLKTLLSAALFAGSTLTFAGCADFGHEPTRAEDSDSDRAHPSTFAEDSEITTKIKAKLAAEKMSSLVKVHVDTDNNGAVVLSGETRTQQDANNAVSIARATEGVTSVKSTIKIDKDD